MKFRGGQGMIPGGYQFTDPRTGFKWMDSHTFPKERVKEIIQHRRLNPTVYIMPQDGKFLDEASVMQELANQNCSRIGNNPHHCVDETAATNVNTVGKPNVAPPVDQKCPDCNAPLVARYCPTCGKNLKIIGYNCPNCTFKINV
jgi:hypothetical protein